MRRATRASTQTLTRQRMPELSPPAPRPAISWSEACARLISHEIVPTSSAATTVRPLLKWAGSKRQLLPALRRFYPARFKAYLEPFFGSGAVFFDLAASGTLDGRRVVLVDSNADLIGCYRMVRDHVSQVLQHLEKLATERTASPTEHYYEVRDTRFNPERDARRRGDAIDYTPELAAMFLYLNRTGFNGLFRVNARGAFNVPAGRYERPRIFDRERLTAVAAALGPRTVQLELGSFTDVERIAEPGDFLYVDPPYAPLSATASFTSYTATRFGSAEQALLQRMLVDLATRGCLILLSNSTAPEIRELYDGNPQAGEAGLRAFQVPARRAINSDATRRGIVSEYLITNIERRPSTDSPSAS